MSIKQAIEALESCDPGDYSTGHVIHPSYDEEKVNAALAALRSMPQGEPVAWGMCKNGLILDCITPAEHESYEGEYTVPLFGAEPMPVKIPIPPPQADALDLVYAEGWNACCDAFFGGLPAPEPLVVTITERVAIPPTEAVRMSEAEIGNAIASHIIGESATYNQLQKFARAVEQATAARLGVKMGDQT